MIEAGDEKLLNECITAREVIRDMYRERALKIYEWTLPEFQYSKRSLLK